MRTLRSHWLILILIFAYTAVLSYKLIATPKPFYDWDESIYVEVGREMVMRHSITPLWQGKAWLEKPPLAPFIYGTLIEYAPMRPEVSTRLLSLFLSAIALSLIYIWILKGTKNKYLGILAVVIIACNPTFLQRTQTVNTDVFLLIGWLGYLITFPRFWLSLIFLFIGVFSKSLLGFYPVILLALYDGYRFMLDRKYKKTGIEHLKMMGIQISIMLIWFAGMTIAYGYEFIQVHFIDHMVRRVTSSIESHFGKRTYYFDLVFIDYGYYSLIAVAGTGLAVYERWKKKITDDQLLMTLFLLPWFLFLNVTKTKISWYIYPAIPQIALLMAYPLKLLEKYRVMLAVVVCILAGMIIQQTYAQGHFLGTYYSDYDETYRLSQLTRQRCDRLVILIDQDGRQTYKVLSDMHLTISTSAIYGNHPSIVYYTSKPIEYVYDKAQMIGKLSTIPSGSCVALEDKDNDITLDSEVYSRMNKFDSWTVYKKAR